MMWNRGFLGNRLFGLPEPRRALLVAEFASITAPASFRTVCKTFGQSVCPPCFNGLELPKDTTETQAGSGAGRPPWRAVSSAFSLAAPPLAEVPSATSRPFIPHHAAAALDTAAGRALGGVAPPPSVCALQVGLSVNAEA